MTIAFLFMILCLWWTFGYDKHLRNGMNPPSPGLSFLVFIVGLLYAIHMVTIALLLWVYEKFHSDYIDSNFLRPADWAANFGGRTLETAHSLYWWLFLVLVILSIIAAICFAVIAHSAWTALDNKVQTKKITLALALIAIVIYGLFTICCYRHNVWVYAFIFH